jgi:uncharacterized membrane protein
MRLALKTLSYGTLHIGVATAVAYALTGNLTAALGIGLIEPLVQTAVFAIHERLWEGDPKPTPTTTPAAIAGA